MKEPQTTTIEVTEEERRLIAACLVMAGTMCTMGATKTQQGLEQYRKTMNLKEKIMGTDH